MNSSTPQVVFAPGFLFTIKLLAFRRHLNSSMNQTCIISIHTGNFSSFSLEVAEGGYWKVSPSPPTPQKNNNQPPVFELIRVAFPKKNQGQKNCFYFFSRRNYHGPWNSNRLFCRFMLVEWFRNTTFIPFYIYKVFIHPKGGCLGFLPYESHCFSKFFCKQKSPLFWVEDREASHKMMYTWAPSAVWP